jgi:predicted HAD superfamily Cof-like phosphohydrolase
MNTQRMMLISCRDQFAKYAHEHRLKASRYSIEKAEAVELADQERLAQLILDTNRKAETNEQMVREIQASLDEPISDVLMSTAMFGAIAYADGVSDKNRQTQLGVHFEEVAEMIETLDSPSSEGRLFLNRAADALTDLADHLKDSGPGQVEIADRANFLDSVCDQLVTVTLSGVLYGMDPVGGLREVNRSNYSKLVDGVMQKAPVTHKWVKGPNYSPPDLTPFINLSLI